MAETALDYMQPLNGSCIYNGIKAQMIGYIRDNDVAYLTFSLQDLEGDRLDETTFIYDYSISSYDLETISPNDMDADSTFHGGVNIFYTSPNNMEELTLVRYEPTTKTAIFNYRFSNHDAINFLEDGNREFYKALQLTIHLIASGAKEGEASLQLGNYLGDPNYKPSTMQADFDDFNRNGYSGVYQHLQTFLTPDEYRGTLLNVPGVYLSNFGIIDDRLHILIKYDRPKNLSINSVLDMTLKSSQKVWDAETERYLKDGEYTGTVCRFRSNNAYYAEYIFDLPDGYTKPNSQTGKTKLLFLEFVDITSVEKIILTLP